MTYFRSNVVRDSQEHSQSSSSHTSTIGAFRNEALREQQLEFHPIHSVLDNVDDLDGINANENRRFIPNKVKSWIVKVGGVRFFIGLFALMFIVLFILVILFSLDVL